MALPTLPHRRSGTTPASGTRDTRAVLPGSARELVLTAPMLLFAHGILAWIDDLGHHGRSGVIWFLAQAALIGSVLAFVGLAGGLAHVVRARDPQGMGLAVNVALGSGIVGAGLTTWVALVRGVGGATATAGAPQWLLAGGPVLLGASLLALLTLARPALALPPRTLGLAAAGLALLALPLDLVPLAAIVLVLALEPLLATDPATLEGDGPSGAR